MVLGLRHAAAWIHTVDRPCDWQEASAVLDLEEECGQLAETDIASQISRELGDALSNGVDGPCVHNGFTLCVAVHIGNTACIFWSWNPVVHGWTWWVHAGAR
jgi:hypothetical protein